MANQPLVVYIYLLEHTYWIFLFSLFIYVIVRIYIHSYEIFEVIYGETLISFSIHNLAIKSFYTYCDMLWEHKLWLINFSYCAFYKRV